MGEIDLAFAHHQAGRLREAEALYRDILTQQPGHADALHLLGVLTLQAERFDEAAAFLQQVLTLKPNHAEARNNLGLVLQAQGQSQEAIAAYRRALEIAPELADAHTNLGLALLDQGSVEDALVTLTQALRLAPGSADAHYNFGNALATLGNMNEAISAFEQALTLEPTHAEACNNLGLALQAEHRHVEAQAALERLLALAPDDPQAHNNLGTALTSQGLHQAGLEYFRHAIAIKPDFAEAHYNLGLALEMQGELDQAVAAYEEALALNPNDHTIENNLGHALLAQGKLAKAIAAFRKTLALKPDFADAHSNLLFCLNYCLDITPADTFAEHLAWGERHAAALGIAPAPYTNPRVAQRRLRIGYVSPDLRTHSVASFIEPLLAAHERNNYEIFCYANVAHADAVTKRLQALADHWRDIAPLSDEEAAGVIREDGIDILVDLAGHTAGARLLIFARRPAPIQVAYLGYPNTRGLATMDYWLSDVCADPVGKTEQYYVEEVVRLPRGFNCYRAPPDSPEVGPLPALRGGHVTFGSFNNASKISAPAIACWAKILTSVPTARLLLKARALADHQTRDRLRQAFATHGIAPERIDMIGRLPASAEHLALYNRVDIGLDTFPYNGHTTTCEALWMGVAVVTLAGNTHAGRVGVSLLTHAGLPQFIADTPEAYAELAVELAADPNRLQKLRRQLRQQMQRSPLTDAEGYTRDLEAAYRGMWEKYCEASST